MITFDDFKKMELRVREIRAAERVPETDKLLHITVDVGTETRQIIAGMAEFYDPSELVGMQVPILMNLEPKTFRGVESHGMILAVDVEGKPIFLHPDEKVPPGSIVR